MKQHITNTDFLAASEKIRDCVAYWAYQRHYPMLLEIGHMIEYLGDSWADAWCDDNNFAMFNDELCDKLWGLVKEGVKRVE